MAEDRRMKGRKFADESPRPPGAPIRHRSLVHIDDLHLMFHEFRTRTSRIMREYKPGSVEMVVAFDEARSDLKAKLQAAGLAEHIDWRDR